MSKDSLIYVPSFTEKAYAFLGECAVDIANKTIMYKYSLCDGGYLSKKSVNKCELLGIVGYIQLNNSHGDRVVTFFGANGLPVCSHIVN